MQQQVMDRVQGKVYKIFFHGEKELTEDDYSLDPEMSIRDLKCLILKWMLIYKQSVEPFFLKFFMSND